MAKAKLKHKSLQRPTTKQVLATLEGDLDELPISKSVGAELVAEIDVDLANMTISNKCDDEGTYPDYVPLGGATTFDEVDALATAEAQAQAVNEVSYQLQNVIYNILAADTTRIPDKGFAIVRAATEFRKRLDDALSSIKGDKAGARHNSKDQEAVQAVHDHSVTLGALCDAAKAHHAAFGVYKGVDGEHYWLGIVSNNFKDRDGEIITEAAHVEYMGYLDANPGKAPELWTWHTPGTGRKARATFWDYADGFTVFGGALTKDEAAAYTPGEVLGMSHGFSGTKQGSLIVRYRDFEVSELPIDKAANPWTDFATIVKEVSTMAFDADKRTYLVKRHGEDYVVALESQLEQTAKVLKDAGVEYKELSEAKVEAVTPVTPVVAAVAQVQPTTPTVDISAVAKELATVLNLDGLNALLVKQTEQIVTLSATISEQQKQLDKLSATADEQIAKAINPTITPRLWGVSAATSPQTVISEKQQTDKYPTGNPANDWVRTISPF